MILVALSLLVAVQTRALPQPAPDVTVVAPATAPQGILEPPTIPPRAALGAGAMPPDPPDPSAYPDTTRMTRIARRMLATIAVGSGVAILVRTCAG